jgi:hypothetical protein
MGAATIEVPVIKTPPAAGGPIESLTDFLKASEKWHHSHSRTNGGMLIGHSAKQVFGRTQYGHILGTKTYHSVPEGTATPKLQAPQNQ